MRLFDAENQIHYSILTYPLPNKDDDDNDDDNYNNARITVIVITIKTDIITMTITITMMKRIIIKITLLNMVIRFIMRNLSPRTQLEVKIMKITYYCTYTSFEECEVATAVVYYCRLFCTGFSNT